MPRSRVANQCFAALMPKEASKLTSDRVSIHLWFRLGTARARTRLLLGEEATASYRQPLQANRI